MPDDLGREEGESFAEEVEVTRGLVAEDVLRVCFLGLRGPGLGDLGILGDEAESDLSLFRRGELLRCMLVGRERGVLVAGIPASSSIIWLPRL